MSAKTLVKLLKPDGSGHMKVIFDSYATPSNEPSYLFLDFPSFNRLIDDMIGDSNLSPEYRSNIFDYYSKVDATIRTPDQTNALLVRNANVISFKVFPTLLEALSAQLYFDKDAVEAKQRLMKKFIMPFATKIRSGAGSKKELPASPQLDSHLENFNATSVNAQTVLTSSERMKGLSILANATLDTDLPESDEDSPILTTQSSSSKEHVERKDIEEVKEVNTSVSSPSGVNITILPPVIAGTVEAAAEIPLPAENSKFSLSDSNERGEHFSNLPNTLSKKDVYPSNEPRRTLDFSSNDVDSTASVVQSSAAPVPVSIAARIVLPDGVTSKVKRNSMPSAVVSSHPVALPAVPEVSVPILKNAPGPQGLGGFLRKHKAAERARGFSRPDMSSSQAGGSSSRKTNTQSSSKKHTGATLASNNRGTGKLVQELVVGSIDVAPNNSTDFNDHVAFPSAQSAQPSSSTAPRAVAPVPFVPTSVAPPVLPPTQRKLISTTSSKPGDLLFRNAMNKLQRQEEARNVLEEDAIRLRNQKKSSDRSDLLVRARLAREVAGACVVIAGIRVSKFLIENSSRNISDEYLTKTEEWFHLQGLTTDFKSSEFQNTSILTAPATVSAAQVAEELKKIPLNYLFQSDLSAPLPEHIKQHIPPSSDLADYFTPRIENTAVLRSRFVLSERVRAARMEKSVPWWLLNLTPGDVAVILSLLGLLSSSPSAKTVSSLNGARSAASKDSSPIAPSPLVPLDPQLADFGVRVIASDYLANLENGQSSANSDIVNLSIAHAHPSVTATPLTGAGAVARETALLIRQHAAWRRQFHQGDNNNNNNNSSPNAGLDSPLTALQLDQLRALAHVWIACICFTDDSFQEGQGATHNGFSSMLHQSELNESGLIRQPHIQMPGIDVAGSNSPGVMGSASTKLGSPSKGSFPSASLVADVDNIQLQQNQTLDDTSASRLTLSDLNPATNQSLRNNFVSPSSNMKGLGSLMATPVIPAVTLLALVQAVITGAYDVRESVLSAAAHDSGLSSDLIDFKGFFYGNMLPASSPQFLSEHHLLLRPSLGSRPAPSSSSTATGLSGGGAGANPLSIASVLDAIPSAEDAGAQDVAAMFVNALQTHKDRLHRLAVSTTLPEGSSVDQNGALRSSPETLKAYRLSLQSQDLLAPLALDILTAKTHFCGVLLAPLKQLYSARLSSVGALRQSDGRALVSLVSSATRVAWPINPPAPSSSNATSSEGKVSAFVRSTAVPPVPPSTALPGDILTGEALRSALQRPHLPGSSNSLLEITVPSAITSVNSSFVAPSARSTHAAGQKKSSHNNNNSVGSIGSASQEFPFSPLLNKKSLSMASKSRNMMVVNDPKASNQEQIAPVPRELLMMQYQQAKEARLREKRAQKLAAELAQCTFKPDLSASSGYHSQTNLGAVPVGIELGQNDRALGARLLGDVWGHGGDRALQLYAMAKKKRTEADRAMQARQLELEDEEIRECTFQPNLSASSTAPSEQEPDEMIEVEVEVDEESAVILLQMHLELEAQRQYMTEALELALAKIDPSPGLNPATGSPGVPGEPAVVYNGGAVKEKKNPLTNLENHIQNSNNNILTYKSKPSLITPTIGTAHNPCGGVGLPMMDNIVNIEKHGKVKLLVSKTLSRAPGLEGHLRKVLQARARAEERRRMEAAVAAGVAHRRVHVRDSSGRLVTEPFAFVVPFRKDAHTISVSPSRSRAVSPSALGSSEGGRAGGAGGRLSRSRSQSRSLRSRSRSQSQPGTRSQSVPPVQSPDPLLNRHPRERISAGLVPTSAVPPALLASSLHTSGLAASASGGQSNLQSSSGVRSRSATRSLYFSSSNVNDTNNSGRLSTADLSSSNSNVKYQPARTRFDSEEYQRGRSSSRKVSSSSCIRGEDRSRSRSGASNPLIKHTYSSSLKAAARQVGVKEVSPIRAAQHAALSQPHLYVSADISSNGDITGRSELSYRYVGGGATIAHPTESGSISGASSAFPASIPSYRVTNVTRGRGVNLLKSITAEIDSVPSGLGLPKADTLDLDADLPEGSGIRRGPLPAPLVLPKHSVTGVGRNRSRSPRNDVNISGPSDSGVFKTSSSGSASDSVARRADRGTKSNVAELPASASTSTSVATSSHAEGSSASSSSSVLAPEYPSSSFSSNNEGAMAVPEPVVPRTPSASKPLPASSSSGSSNSKPAAPSPATVASMTSTLTYDAGTPPLLYVDVTVAAGKVERIPVWADSDLQQISNSFVEKHSLPQKMSRRLQKMILAEASNAGIVLNTPIAI